MTHVTDAFDNLILPQLYFQYLLFPKQNSTQNTNKLNPNNIGTINKGPWRCRTLSGLTITCEILDLALLASLSISSVKYLLVSPDSIKPDIFVSNLFL